MARCRRVHASDDHRKEAGHHRCLVVLVRPGGRGAGKDLRIHAAPVPGGRAQAGHEVLKVLREIDALAASLHRKLAGCDALLAPTVPRSPPAIADLVGNQEAYTSANAGMLRNTTPGNLTKLCALTLPCGVDDSGMPAGLMLRQGPTGRRRCCASQRQSRRPWQNDRRSSRRSG